MSIYEQSKLDFLDVVKLAAAVTDCPCAMIAFKDGGVFKIQASLGFPPGYEDVCPFFETVIGKGSALYINDVGANNEFKNNSGVLKLGVQFYLGVPIFNSDGEVLGVLSVGDTKTKRLKDDQIELFKTLSYQVGAISSERVKMIQLNRFSKMMEEIHHLNSGAEPLDSLFEEYLKKGIEILGLEYGIISNVLGDEYSVEYVISPNDSIIVGSKFAVGDTYCSDVIKMSKTVFYQHIGENERMCNHPVYTNMQLESFIGTPIFSNGEIIGTLNFSSKSVRKDGYSKEEVKFIEILAQLISKEIQENRRKKLLAENREWLNMAVSGSGVAFWAFDTVRRVIQVNKGVSNLFGEDGGVYEIKFHDWLETIYYQDQQKVLNLFEEVKQGEVDVSLEFRKEEEGALRYYKIVGRVKKSAFDSSIKIFGASWDITEEKNKEAKLEGSLKQFKTLAELAPIGIFLTDERGGSKFLNQCWMDMAGFEKDEGQGDGWGEALHPEDREGVFQKWETIVAAGKEWSEGFRIQNIKNGRVTHVYTKATPLKDEHGKVTGYIGINLDITEQLKLEEKLISNVQQLENFISSIPSGVAMFDKDMRYKAASERWLKDNGLEAKNIKGVCHYDLFKTLPERWKQGHLEALKGASLTCSDDSFIKENGQIEWLDWDVRPWRDSNGEIGGILMQVEITTQKKIEQLEFSKVSEIQKVMLDNTAYSMIATDTEGVVTVFNKGAEKLLGYSAEEVIGKHSPIIFHDPLDINNKAESLSCEFGEKINNGFDAVIAKCKRSGEIDQGQWTYVAKNGNRVPVSLAVSPMKNKDNQIFGYLGIAQDITSKIEYEKNLIEAKERAIENAELKSRFLANMSHEIRTPLNSIVGLSDLLSQESLDGDASRYIKTIHDSSEVLLNIVNDILDLSKIEANEMKLYSAPFRLKGAVEKIVSLFEWQLAEKRIGLFLDFEDGLEDVFIGDEGRLHQVLVNLLGNALKFTLNGSVTLHVKRNTDKKVKGNIHFSVVDTGIGIPKQMLDTIFESFSQAETSTTKRFGGTGLGLSITKQLVQLMGGSVWVESDSQSGSTFSFTVDLKPVDSDVSLIVQESSDYKPKLNSELRVLLVDDSINNRNLVKAFLKDQGWSIVEAQNGQEAVELMREMEFDIVLMDMQMPIMDGFKATQTFRKWESDHRLGRIPIIALTAYALEEEKQRSFNAGCDEHLAKPLKKKVLLEAIDKQIEDVRNAI